jgi:predicted NBD/HSP70 family sugar kinase
MISAAMDEQQRRNGWRWAHANQRLSPPIQMNKTNSPREQENRTTSQTKQSVVGMLLQHGPMSRSDLAKSLDLSPAPLTGLSRKLIEQGLVQESAVQHGARQGRPSILLTLNPSYGYFLGVCITDAPPVLTLCDLNGNVLEEHPLEATREPEMVAANIQEGLEKILVSQRISREKILGIGLAVSGIIDRKSAICRLSNDLDWRDVPIAELVNQATGIPVYLENDANAVATGEKLFGSAKTIHDFIAITLNHSIGAGHYIKGELYRGYGGGAGEIGHTTIDLNGALCPCGKKGCLDMISGSKALLKSAHEKGLDVKNVTDIESLAVAGNTEAIGILYRAGQAVGLAATHMIHSTNPQSVILAMSSSSAGGVFIAATLHTIESNILPSLRSTTEILFHRVDGNFCARGAASIAAHQYFLSQAST